MVALARSSRCDQMPHAASPLLLGPPASKVLVENLDRGVERRVRRSRSHVVQRVASSLDDPLRLTVREKAVLLEPDQQLEDEGPSADCERANGRHPFGGSALRHGCLPVLQRSTAGLSTDRRHLPRRLRRGARRTANINPSAATDAPLGDCPAAAILPGGRRHFFDRSPSKGALKLSRGPKLPGPAARDALNFRILRRGERALHARQVRRSHVQEVGCFTQERGVTCVCPG